MTKEVDCGRRKLLNASGSLLTLSLTGCTGNTERSTTTATETTTSTETTTQTETTTSVEIPSVFSVDFQYQENTEKLSQLNEISNNFNNIDTANTAVVQNNSTEHEYDNQGIDLTSLQLHHKNNFEQIEKEWAQDIVETLDQPSEYEEEKNREATEKYLEPYDSFNFEAFTEAETLVEGHQILMPWISDYEALINDRRLHSTRDKQYAAIIQESFDQYNDNIDIHTWAFKVGFGRHGNGLMYDETNDSLHITETVGDSPADQGLDPVLIENSRYLMKGTMWHPAQFEHGEYGSEGFESAKSEAAGMFNLIVTKYDDVTDEMPVIPGENIAPTTGLIKDVAGALGNYNENSYDFNTDLKNSALTLEKLRRTDGEFIIDEIDYQDDSIVIEAYDASGYEESSQLLDEVWRDEEGLYDNFGNIVQEFQNGDFNTLSETAEALAS